MSASKEVVLAMWVIYWDTLDFPGAYTVRRFNIWSDGTHGPDNIAGHSVPESPLTEEGKHAALQVARRMIPREKYGLIKTQPHSSDDPVIVEVWI